ncbi:MAG: hypothetical protein AAGD40_11050, partial [Pseudomonadota bacterium]
PVFAQSESPEIVVTARKLAELRAGLEDCISRKCPPLEDIAASVAYAEEQFMGGDYRQARNTLHDAIGRNREFAGEYPVAVSGLYRASSRTAEHLGLPGRMMDDLRNMHKIVVRHAPENHAQRVTMEIELADGMTKLGGVTTASHMYEDAENLARTHGDGRLAALARLRRIALMLNYPSDKYDASYTEQQLRVFRLGRMAKARKMLDEMLADPMPGAEDQMLVADMLGRRIDLALDRAEDEDMETYYRDMEQIAKTLPPSSRPILLTHTVMAAHEGETQQPAGDRLHGGREAWADAEYRIAMDGTVTDIEIIASGGSEDWPDLVAKSLMNRRYLPPVYEDQFSPGNIRVERFSRTYDMEDSARAGTRIRVRTSQATVRALDITPG